jgi:hypothetical protein
LNLGFSACASTHLTDAFVGLSDKTSCHSGNNLLGSLAALQKSPGSVSPTLCATSGTTNTCGGTNAMQLYYNFRLRDSNLVPTLPANWVLSEPKLLKSESRGRHIWC